MGAPGWAPQVTGCLPACLQDSGPHTPLPALVGPHPASQPSQRSRRSSRSLRPHTSQKVGSSSSSCLARALCTGICGRKSRAPVAVGPHRGGADQGLQATWAGHGAWGLQGYRRLRFCCLLQGVNREGKTAPTEDKVAPWKGPRAE